ncbi:phage holin family protein [Exiguobacterium sp. s123]
MAIKLFVILTVIDYVTELLAAAKHKTLNSDAIF